jgi:hypothetical protein
MAEENKKDKQFFPHMVIPQNTGKLYNFQYSFHLFKNMMEICKQAIIPIPLQVPRY